MTLLLAGLVVLVLAATLVRLAWSGRTLSRLDRVPVPTGAPFPSVSVVIAARDEAAGLEAALRSVLAQDHPRLEVLVVDDRSSDATPAILRRLQAEAPALRVLRVDALPEGWLGKNHALHVGAAAASGELILFTDADVVMHPTTVRRAAAYLARRGLDHLTVAPRVLMRGWLAEAVVIVFGIGFTLLTRPWRVEDPDDPAHVGIGAFNLLRAAAYRAMGGHEPIRMRPDDDLKLGKLVKKHGLRQGFAVGVGLIAVEWYAGVGDLARGLRKNAFAGLDYRVDRLVAATALLLLVAVWPFAALVLTAGPARVAYLAAALLLLLLYAGAARHQGASPWRAPLLPLACLLLLAVVWGAVLYTLRRGGIEWRGTRYPLAALRANRV